MPLLIVALVAALAVAGAAVWRLRGIRKTIIAPLQHRLDQHEQELRQARDISDARNLFLGMLSHELRTPLSGITGAVHLLRATGLNDRQQEYARMIAYASRTVLEIVDDMLTFSRVHAGQVDIEPVVFDLHDVVDDMLSLQTLRAQERGLALIRDVADDVPGLLVGDRGKLNQILLNVIGNAIKFTDEGSVTVSVRLANAPQRVTDPIRLVFSITDTGIGMQAEELQTLFRPFAQGRAARHDKRGGTGLGLSICQRLVDAMGGRMTMESQPGHGTCVRFELVFQLAAAPPVLPCDATPGARMPPQQEQLPAARSGLARRFVVLVVDDDEINRLVCTRYLALAGHHPLAAANAGQALHLLATSAHVPDAILMDINLAGQSGAELADALRAGPQRRWADAVFIAMSADVSGTSRQLARAAGMVAFLTKPFSAGQLEKTLQANVISPSGSAPRVSADAWLDLDYLRRELDVLGPDVLLELLNIFRSSSATTLLALSQAVQRRDADLVRQHAHALQGSAGNLGMCTVARRAAALQRASDDEAAWPDDVASRLDELESACHDSADALRQVLQSVLHQHVAFTAYGQD